MEINSGNNLALKFIFIALALNLAQAEKPTCEFLQRIMKIFVLIVQVLITKNITVLQIKFVYRH